jgi:hypothetical protein
MEGQQGEEMVLWLKDQLRSMFTDVTDIDRTTASKGRPKKKSKPRTKKPVATTATKTAAKKQTKPKRGKS